MSAKRHRHAAHEEEEHENHERWLITYADMITLLMVLFIVLFAIGQTDLAKFQALKHSLKGALGGPVKPNPVVNGGAGLLVAGSQVDGVPDATGTTPGPASRNEAQVALIQKRAAEQAAAVEHTALTGAEQQIQAALSSKGLQRDVTFRLEARGLVVTVVTDHVLYQVGSAGLQPAGQAVLDAVAPAIERLPNHITIEGHTDDQPILPGGTYPSNWELSTARATTVLRYLIDAYHFDPGRLSASGYADTRPIAPNTSDANRALNRRVEIVVDSLTADKLEES
jgi:chemotaxis protein MotB